MSEQNTTYERAFYEGDIREMEEDNKNSDVKFEDTPESIQRYMWEKGVEEAPPFSEEGLIEFEAEEFENKLKITSLSSISNKQ